MTGMNSVVRRSALAICARAPNPRPSSARPTLAAAASWTRGFAGDSGASDGAAGSGGGGGGAPQGPVGGRHWAWPPSPLRVGVQNLPFEACNAEGLGSLLAGLDEVGAHKPTKVDWKTTKGGQVTGRALVEYGDAATAEAVAAALRDLGEVGGRTLKVHWQGSSPRDCLEGVKRVLAKAAKAAKTTPIARPVVAGGIDDEMAPEEDENGEDDAAAAPAAAATAPAAAATAGLAKRVTEYSLAELKAMLGAAGVAADEKGLVNLQRRIAESKDVERDLLGYLDAYDEFTETRKALIRNPGLGAAKEKQHLALILKDEFMSAEEEEDKWALKLKRRKEDSAKALAESLKGEAETDEEAVARRQREIEEEAWDAQRIKMGKPAPFEGTKHPTDLLPGKWCETIVAVDRVMKIIKGGSILSYRVLVVVGNVQGAGGFGVGKGPDPATAAARAIREAKKNVVVVDRYKAVSLVESTEGRHNSCRVLLRAVPPGAGLKGGKIAQAILTQMGIADCTAKAHGRRTPIAVVRAIFKALARHRSLHDISRARGRRILELESRRGK